LTASERLLAIDSCFGKLSNGILPIKHQLAVGKGQLAKGKGQKAIGKGQRAVGKRQLANKPDKLINQSTS
jgi:hypothetical protein